jgi:hemolysin
MTDEKKGLFNANLNAGRVNETTRTLAGGQITSQERITLAGESIHLQGTQPTAPDVRFDAGEGGVNLESALSSKSRDNWNVELKGGGNLSGSTPTAADPAGVASNDYGFNGLAKVGIDNLRSSTSQNSLTKADRVELDSAGDVQLAGARMDAGTVNGKVGGDLTVQSRQDQLNHKRFDVDLGLTGNKPAPVQPDSVATNVAPKAFDYKPTFKFDGEYAYKDSVGQASGINGIQGVNLAVGGATQLTGARIASPEGRVDLGDSNVGTTPLSNLDHRIKAGLELPQKPAGGVTKPDVSSSDLQTLNFGPVSVGSRFDTDSLQAGVDEGKL